MWCMVTMRADLVMVRTLWSSLQTRGRESSLWPKMLLKRSFMRISAWFLSSRAFFSTTVREYCETSMRIAISSSRVGSNPVSAPARSVVTLCGFLSTSSWMDDHGSTGPASRNVDTSSPMVSSRRFCHLDFSCYNLSTLRDCACAFMSRTSFSLALDGSQANAAYDTLAFAHQFRDN